MDAKNALVGIEWLVSDKTNARLDEEPSEDDFKEAFFQMHTNKSHCLDGMHALFFQNSRTLLGQILFRVCKIGGEMGVIFQR